MSLRFRIEMLRTPRLIGVHLSLVDTYSQHLPTASRRSRRTLREIFDCVVPESSQPQTTWTDVSVKGRWCDQQHKDLNESGDHEGR